MAPNDVQTARIMQQAIWNTADRYLRNVVEPEDYGDYILPFTVLRRLECMLADSKGDVVKYVESFAGMPQHLIDIAVKDRFGLDTDDDEVVDGGPVAASQWWASLSRDHQRTIAQAASAGPDDEIRLAGSSAEEPAGSPDARR